jgi:hypothetical protein
MPRQLEHHGPGLRWGGKPRREAPLRARCSGADCHGKKESKKNKK